MGDGERIVDTGALADERAIRLGIAQKQLDQWVTRAAAYKAMADEAILQLSAEKEKLKLHAEAVRAFNKGEITRRELTYVVIPRISR
jgi:hypothetical protein